MTRKQRLKQQSEVGRKTSDERPLGDMEKFGVLVSFMFLKHHFPGRAGVSALRSMILQCLDQNFSMRKIALNFE